MNIVEKLDLAIKSREIGTTGGFYEGDSRYIFVEARCHEPYIAYWDYIDSALSEDIYCLKGVCSIDISQSEHDKSTFEVETDQGKLIVIDTEEPEKLELALLAEDGIDVEEIIERNHNSTSNMCR